MGQDGGLASHVGDRRVTRLGVCAYMIEHAGTAGGLGVRRERSRKAKDDPKLYPEQDKDGFKGNY